MKEEIIQQLCEEFSASGKRYIVVCGPTASGKSALSVELAMRLHGEIISADSRQIYKGMDIGTGKITKEEMNGIPHFGLDIAGPDEVFTVADFRDYAWERIGEIERRGHTPIIAGGTGLYINALLHGLTLAPKVEEHIRQGLEEELQEHGIEYMYAKLESLDPEEAQRVGRHNARYILRDLEIYMATGKRKSEMVSQESHSEFFVICLNWDREQLNKRINKRHKQMFEGGAIIEETKHLLEMGYDKSHEAMTSIGYRECLKVLGGMATQDEALEEIKIAARRYAKKQMTWFRRLARMYPVRWVTCTD